jgi:hypothetical protein
LKTNILLIKELSRKLYNSSKKLLTKDASSALRKNELDRRY